MKVIDAYLFIEDDDVEPQHQLVIVFEDGSEVAENISKESYDGWKLEGLEERECQIMSIG